MSATPAPDPTSDATTSGAPAPAVTTAGGYAVPVDPMDQLQCDACQ